MTSSIIFTFLFCCTENMYYICRRNKYEMLPDID
nr:MAG TPA: hypothetical protein [Caudoviricetes sp.]